MSVGVRGPMILICGDGERHSWIEDGVVMRISYDVFVVRVVGVEWFAFVTSCLLEMGRLCVGRVFCCRCNRGDM